ncbi:MAG: hypothetical protein JWL76_257 [Thermoleophilia bacterium]|nr:hypothetical protein [Thermoleophilia bacterium]
MRTIDQPQYLLRPLLSDLVRWDASFSRARGTTPTREYVASFDGLQERVLRAAQSLQTSPYDALHPVGSSLERDAAQLMRVSTSLAGMQARGTTFGPGWERVLDQSISDVRYGLQLLGDGSFPAPTPQPPYPPQYPDPYPPQYPTPYSPQYPPSPDPTWPNPAPYPGDGGWGA